MKIFKNFMIDSGILKELYSDLAQPGIRKVGLALETVFDLSNTVLLPLKLRNEKAKVNFEINLLKYKEKLDGIAENEIVQVHPLIGLPILDRLTYVSNNDIADAFITLLSSASWSKKNGIAHPGFIKKIDEITPDEAKILKFINSKGFNSIPTIHVICKYHNRDGMGQQSKSLRNLNEILLNVDLSFPNMLSLYIDNLIQLGLLVKENDGGEFGNGVFKNIRFQHEDKINKFEKEILAKYKFTQISYQKTVYRVTEYGNAFIEACIS